MVYLNRAMELRDHVLHRGHRGDIGLIGAGGIQQIHHILGRVHFGKRDIAFGVGVGMAGQVAHFRRAVVLGNVGDCDAGGQLVLEHGGKGRFLQFARKNHVFAAYGPPSGVRVVSALAMFSTSISARVRSACMPDALT